MDEQNIIGPADESLNANPNMKWYIIHTYSGFEKKVKESLESRIPAFELSSADPVMFCSSISCCEPSDAALARATMQQPCNDVSDS